MDYKESCLKVFKNTPFELSFTFSQIPSVPIISLPELLQLPAHCLPFSTHFLYSSSLPHNQGYLAPSLYLFNSSSAKLSLIQCIFLTYSTYILVKQMVVWPWTFLSKIKYQLVSPNLLSLNYNFRNPSLFCHRTSFLRTFLPYIYSLTLAHSKIYMTNINEVFICRETMLDGKKMAKTESPSSKGHNPWGRQTSK